MCIRDRLLTPGMTEQLKAEVVKNESDQVELAWSSDRTDVATVDENGLIKAVAAGEATITLTERLRNVTASCTVYVQDLSLIHICSGRSKYRPSRLRQWRP